MVVGRMVSRVALSMMRKTLTAPRGGCQARPAFRQFAAVSPVREYRESTPTKEAESMMRALVIMGLAALLMLPVGEAVRGSLYGYSSVRGELCQGMASEFHHETGSTVLVSQYGSGEMLE